MLSLPRHDILLLILDTLKLTTQLADFLFDRGHLTRIFHVNHPVNIKAHDFGCQGGHFVGEAVRVAAVFDRGE